MGNSRLMGGNNLALAEYMTAGKRKGEMSLSVFKSMGCNR